MKKILKILLICFLFCFTIPLVACDYENTSSIETTPPDSSENGSSTEETLPPDGSEEVVDPGDEDSKPSDGEDNNDQPSDGEDIEEPQEPQPPTAEQIAKELEPIVNSNVEFLMIFAIYYNIDVTTNDTNIIFVVNCGCYDEAQNVCLPEMLNDFKFTVDDGISTAISNKNLTYSSSIEENKIILNFTIL